VTATHLADLHRRRHDEEDLRRCHDEQDLRFHPDGDLGFTPDGQRCDNDVTGLLPATATDATGLLPTMATDVAPPFFSLATSRRPLCFVMLDQRFTLPGAAHNLRAGCLQELCTSRSFTH
jgi:hypothetical protein